jgi:protocatechuate 3,4-dioxygenase alpha subunit
LGDIYGGDDPGARMITGDVAGQRMRLTGVLWDGAGDPVTDGMIEIWQAGPDGTFAPPGFTSWGRQPCDSKTGAFAFDTLKPGSVAGQAPHILVWIVARGIGLGLATRIYFPDQDNSRDPVFALAGARAQTLLAAATPAGYHFDIHLQGPKETVFFDV